MLLKYPELMVFTVGSAKQKMITFEACTPPLVIEL